MTDRVKTFILSHPDVHLNKTRWVEGMGWDQTRWAGSQFPTAVSTVVCSLYHIWHVHVFGLGRSGQWSSVSGPTHIIDPRRWTCPLGISTGTWAYGGTPRWCRRGTHSKRSKWKAHRFDYWALSKCHHDSCNVPGVFIDNAMRLIPAPAWTDEQLYQFFNATMKQALSFGLTSIHDAWTTPEQITFFMK